jgi:hypothetical protein
LVERSEITRFEYSEVLVCDGREHVMNFKARNRVVLQAWAIDPRAHLVWNKESIKFKGPIGAEIAVRFAIGE